MFPGSFLAVSRDWYVFVLVLSLVEMLQFEYGLLHILVS